MLDQHTVIALPSAAGTENADAALIGLCEQHRVLRDRFLALNGDPDEVEARSDILQAQMTALTDRIENTRAATLHGIECKAWVLDDLYGRNKVDFWGDAGKDRTTDIRILYSVLADLGVNV